MAPAQVAQIAYEINKAYAESLGDNSFSSWEDAPEWQKHTNLDGVMFHLNNPDAAPSASHENWLKVKEQEGWRYGAVKNADAKEHPCFLPFNELPVHQQAKDFIFKQVVHSLKPFIAAE